MSTVVIRNGSKLCERCRDKGCERSIVPGRDVEEPYISNEPCECCELDFQAEDDFGL